MANKIILPKLGQTMEEGTIVEWLVQEGDDVARGDVLCTVESDKAVLEVESRNKGTLLKILLQPGIKAPVLSAIGVIGQAGEDISALLDEAGGDAGGTAASAAPAATPQPVAEVESAPLPEPVQREGRLFASPRARKLAREKGVDLAYVAGSGPNGRVIEKDVQAFLASQPSATPLARKIAAEQGVALGSLAADGRIRAAQIAAPVAQPAATPLAPAAGAVTPMSGVRAIIADRMGTSAHTTAAVTLQSVVDVTEFVALRTKLKDAYAKELGFSIGYNDILVAIVARCLIEHPEVNARLDQVDGKTVIRQLDTINMGMAVDSGRGLLVPVIRDAQTKGIKQIARDFRALVDRAREGKSGPDDLTGGTFTITNLGMFGIDQFTPIINLPECAILGVGRIKEEPVVVDGQVVVRQRMWLSLTFDHRLVDGAPAARFLQAIMGYIEAPYLLLG